MKNKYTEEEMALIRQHYPMGGAKAVQAAGVERPLRSIGKKAADMGVKMHRDALSDLRRNTHRGPSDHTPLRKREPRYASVWGMAQGRTV
jgi:hypothetical protein